MKFKDFISKKLKLQTHKELNPKLWKDNELNDKVRRRLINLGMYFVLWCDFDQKDIIDITLTGANANYNYTDLSDLDVHVIMDKEKMDCEKFIDEYILDKKNLWSLKHDIKVEGYPVELFVQGDKDPTPAGQGVYSLFDKKWIKKPEYQEIDTNNVYFKKKLFSLIKQIEFFTEHDIDDLEKMEAFKEKLRKMRSSGLKKEGEYSMENLLYKELRNEGYLDKFNDHYQKAVDKKFTL
jgi:hypothetical protein